MSDFTNNSNSSDSSIFQGKIRPEDLNKTQEANKFKGTTEDLFKKIELQKQEYEELREKAGSEIQGMLTPVMLCNDDLTDSDIVKETLAELGKFFQSLFSEFEIEVDPKTYEIIKEKRENNLLLSIIKFMHDKLKELVKKVFSRDLSFGEKIDKGIKELEEKLLSGSLSKEGEVTILERLEALRKLKLKLQMAVAGWIVAMIAKIFTADLVAAEEGTVTTKKEDKKVEKKSSKKEVEVCKEIEIKVGENGKLRILPISLFITSVRDQSNGLITPLLEPEERNLLREPLKNLMLSETKYDINKEDREVEEKLKVKEINKKESIQASEVLRAVCSSTSEQLIVEERIFVGVTGYSNEKGQYNDIDRQGMRAVKSTDKQDVRSVSNSDVETVKLINVGKAYSKFFAGQEISPESELNFISVKLDNVGKSR
ncbi:hypothetical protein GOY07_02410 [Wolbachia endosymbiont of Litomosoides sigmodontis]|uniref:hypothetical protein n=1 Tax=Wolbachia endosymbiont of Litomosoides sigmodontis TaxID=80850 RepID=UPI0015892F76|nr:hypothetical protein [Wolbachia endosymbiont of Litomosoides sigmodontis]QKX03045.1 hypothetical protein GOY07_02410 [Wolbachia endosymbiont of Litomosoides sigmodontis]